MLSFSDIWNQVIERCSAGSVVLYDTWFSTFRNADYRDGRVILTVDSNFRKQVVENQFAEDIKNALGEIMGFKPVFEVRVELPEEAEELPPLSPEDNCTFDRFIVGPSNRMAHAAALRVAEEPGTAYNPLFLYGHSGLGKTHLMLAIKNELLAKKPYLNVIYVSGEYFTNELIFYLQEKNMTEFHDKYRSADVLLIDDIQFIQDKTQTQEEFFHTFNTLVPSGRQVVVSADMPPHAMTRLEERIRTRFEQGMLADISAPDKETRMAILDARFGEKGLDVPRHIIDYLANEITLNIRKLEGAVTQLTALSTVTGTLPTMEDARTVVSGLKVTVLPPEITTEKVLKTVCDNYGVTPADLKSEKRQSNISEARQVSMYAIRETTGMNLKAIGAVFNKTHPTVHHSIEKVEERIKTDPAFASDVADIIKDIRGEY